jgi:hypothetical protein
MGKQKKLSTFLIKYVKRNQGKPKELNTVRCSKRNQGKPKELNTVRCSRYSKDARDSAL